MSGYNGWTNYETWCVNLWWNNDQGSYESARWVVRKHDRSDLESGRLAEAIKSETEELCPSLGSGGSLESDLISGALSDVNWQEIAEEWAEHFGLPDDDPEGE